MVLSFRGPSLDAQLNVYNFPAMRGRSAERYDYLRFDPNNACNVHCVYCHNHRSADVVPTDELILQTNGILLHQHSAATLVEAGLTRLAVSIDSADPDVHRALRGGTSVAKLARNIRAFHEACPAVEIHFITTVTRANLPTLDQLVTVGLELGVSRFVLREVFYYPDSDVVDHSRMPGLVLRQGEYAEMAARLTQRFGDRTAFEFADQVRLAAAEQKMSVDSLAGRMMSGIASEAPRQTVKNTSLRLRFARAVSSCPAPHPTTHTARGGVSLRTAGRKLAVRVSGC